MSKKQRALWLVLALLFLGTAVGGGIYSIIQSNQQSKDNQTNNQSKENTTKKLAGTPLNSFTPVAKIDNLQEIDLSPGTGAVAAAGSTVTVNYTGAIASTGTIFESSLDSGQTATFPLANVIKGWQEGIPGMKVGGTRRLMIPAALAYGAQGNSTIPANSDLVFDVTLLSVK